MNIEMVILDWAGTTVDYGCFAPVNAFVKAFTDFGIIPTMDEVREPMGMLKIDHIRTMLKMERINKLWYEKYGRDFDEDDVNKIYASFEKKLFESIESYSVPKEYAVETVNKLRDMGIKIGSTTGYTNEMMNVVKKASKEYGYAPDFLVTPDDCGFGRPYPYMIFENMRLAGVSSVKNVLKIGDTISDIKEGKNAGVCTVGIIDGSSETGLTKAEFDALTDEQKTNLRENVRKCFLDAGADFVIENLNGIFDLPVMK